MNLYIKNKILKLLNYILKKTCSCSPCNVSKCILSSFLTSYMGHKAVKYLKRQINFLNMSLCKLQLCMTRFIS